MVAARDEQQWQPLIDYLHSELSPEHSMDSHQLDGYLRAIASAPVELPLSYYSELVFGESKVRFNNEGQRQDLMESLVAFSHFHQEQVRSGECELPFTIEYSAQKHDRIEVEQWARGYMQGYILAEKEWNELLALCPTSTSEQYQDSEEQIDDNLLALSTVADADFAFTEGRSEHEVAECFRSLPDTVRSLAELGLMLKAWMMEHKPELQARFVDTSCPVVVAPKLGRNDPCSCGSGRKYKKCCG
ncbi:uncharacterized protein EDC56_0338 [Sinobacterium caligoides]|uniref:YecA family protein n=1 Tax=Sinobacterium caligoides TaxID=933926 RepID=A0A3N2DZT7_9GAMM|nr:UPF0149 family protein [Sinobacterium caligoides]ROS04825.1 uncharacterized protein EDC56_0338 [Sinobacterium caligoides]